MSQQDIERGWVKEKPICDREFSMVSASWWRDHWEFKAWTVQKVEHDEGWYYGLFDDGDEWGEYDDLTADLFYILPEPPNSQTPKEVNK